MRDESTARHLMPGSGTAEEKRLETRGRPRRTAIQPAAIITEKGGNVKMRDRAEKALREMGMPEGIKGFRYIADAMGLYGEDEAWMAKLMPLYGRIAGMHGTSPFAVSLAIQYAFSTVMRKGLPAVVKYMDRQHTSNGKMLAKFYLGISKEGGNA